MLKASDEDRWLSAQFAPAAVRAKLVALFLLYREIERVPEAVKEPPIGEIRLQWWRDALAACAIGGGPRGHPALDAARNAALFTSLSPADFDALIEARARLLYEPHFNTAAELGTWAAGPEGDLAHLAARLGDGAAARECSGLRAVAAAFGALRMRAARLARPEDSLSAVLDAAQAGAREMRGMSESAKAAILYLAITTLYAHRRRPTGLAKRWRLFSALLDIKAFPHFGRSEQV